MIIFGAGFVGEILAGLMTYRWKARGGDSNVVMSTMLSIAGIMTALSIFLLSTTYSLAMAITLLSIALFFLLWGRLFWSIPAAISQREHVGTVGGCMNLAGNIAGVVTPIYVGFIVSATGSYNLVLIIFTLAGLLLALCSFLINYKKKVGF